MSIPNVRAIACAVALLSPVIMAIFSPASCNALSALGVVSLIGSATPIIATSSPSTAANSGVLPLAPHAADRPSAAARETPSRVINLSAPTSTLWPSTSARTPWPVWDVKDVTCASDSSSASAWRMMAVAIGCSDLASTEATSRKASDRVQPLKTSRSVTSGRPAVSVPVLSSAMVSTSAKVCSASPLRNSTPSSAPRPVPTMIEVGVARPIAQGQAIISTATLATSANPNDGCGPTASQIRKVAAAIAMTAGTNHMVMRLTKS